VRIDGNTVKTALLIAGLAAGLLALTAVFGPPAGGLSESEAIKIASRDAQSASITTPHLVLVRHGQWSEFRDGAGDETSPNRWVWAMVFSGLYQGSGGPPVLDGQPRREPVFVHSRLVVLDYVTGQFVMASEPSPIPWGGLWPR
jgi:hypothetical protein